MSNPYQQASFRRKLIYFGTILGLFVVSLFARGVVRLEEQTPSWTVRGQAEQLEITEQNQGDPELAGATMRLLLTGSRGLAVCALWISAQEKQKVHDWSELELLVRSVTKLQPHFVTPWQFQSWNIAYNVSVELERLNDMYFYISRGISLLAEGETLNKNNPDIRYTIAFYYQNKFGVSDKVNTLRCLYELSCIPFEERYHRKFYNEDGKTVNLSQFEEFCRANPQLVRRLRESTVACRTPLEVVQFLRDNEKVPSRYRERTNELEVRLKQFPVLPPLAADADPLSPLSARFTDKYADGYLAAHRWFRYSLEVVPPPHPVPGPSFNPDPHKYRIPRQPMLIIFRQGAPRALEYVAERLQAEGWYDDSPWVIDKGLEGSERWFKKDRVRPGAPVVTVSGMIFGARPSVEVPNVVDELAIPPSDTALQAWKDARSAWEQHGNANGFFSESERQQYESRALHYANLRGVPLGARSDPRPEDLDDPEIKASYEAHAALFYLQQNLFVTAFDKHLQRCIIETDRRAMAARKLIAEADLYKRTEYSPNPERSPAEEARRLYDQGFELWKQVIRDSQHLRELESVQEELIEKQIQYDSLLKHDFQGGERRRAILLASDILGQAGGAWGGGTARSVLGAYTLRPLARELVTFNAPGPLDGIDPKTNTPWIRQDIKDRVAQRLGTFRPRTDQTAPKGPSGSPPAGPSAGSGQ